MTELSDSSEDLDDISPLKVSPETVWNENVRNNLIGDKESGASPEVMADIGFKPPKLGEVALEGRDFSKYPDKIEPVRPSAETIRHWVEDFKYEYTSDGTCWFCALDSKGNIFAKVEAEGANNAANTILLYGVTQPLLSTLRQGQALVEDEN